MTKVNRIGKSGNNRSVKRWMLAAVIAATLILVTVGNGAAEAASGDVIGTYRGVDAYSNGVNAGTGSGPYEYQCVAYVKRFYNSDAMDMDTSGWTGNGDMYYDSASAKGLDAYPNGGSVPPQPDDILTFNGPTYGHVAIIMEVGDTYVNVIEQNWNRNTAYATLTKTGNNLPDRSGYHIQGWLRKPGAHILDQSISPTIVAHGDELTFVYNIDNPYPDSIENVRLGAQIRTNDPQGDWIDDPANDKVVTLLPGAHDYSRTFIVPQTASSGFYDARWVMVGFDIELGHNYV
jgi:surface antigen